jgi:Protein of unknown function (DUF3105)
MTKRRTSGIQRRGRASEAAMTRRVSPTGARGGSALDPRLLVIGGVLVVGIVVLVVFLLFGGGAAARVGERQVDDGGGHIADGSAGGGYSSVPATSGEHWNTPGEWGVYPPGNPAAQAQVIHNLEHGGIVIWYQPTQASAEDVAALTQYVEQQVRAAKFKVILSPWTGEDFGHPIGVTAWNWLLYQDEADIDQIRDFLEDHYGEAPEPFGGPGQPAG